MEKRYFLNNTDLEDLIDEFFPTKQKNIGFVADETKLTEENIEKFSNKLEFFLNDVRIEEKEIPDNDLETIDVDLGLAYDKIKNLFSDSDLNIYGHGGNIEQIMNSGHFYCKYPNLDSHFLHLSWGEGLNALNNWEHIGAKKIIFLALNNNEVNPIYKNVTNSVENYNFNFEIPLEYFAGYYDSELKDFIPNPLFKKEHKYNEDLTRHYMKDSERMLSNNSVEIINIFKALDLLSFCVQYSSSGLSENGYRGLCDQGKHCIKVLKGNLIAYKNSMSAESLLKELDDEILEKKDDFVWDIDNMSADFNDDSIDWDLGGNSPKL